MKTKKNIVAAAIAAVGLYLESEQPLETTRVQVVEQRTAPRQAYSPWAMSGRQSAMEMRRLIQMRLVR
jgi:hypothetical protein